MSDNTVDFSRHTGNTRQNPATTNQNRRVFPCVWQTPNPPMTGLYQQSKARAT
ncbi:MAG: hypothetical protein PHI13_08470 [Methylococcales bacterium]|nr:hypothetical protein [Methylococcales bacterium]